MDATDRKVRKFVFDYFLEHAQAPTAPEISLALRLDLRATQQALRALDSAHHLKLLEGTCRILMAFPFSALATPFAVTRENGQRYFANCAWDSIAFHPMLREPVRIDSFCDRCGRPVRFRVEKGRGVPDSDALPTVWLALPAAQWWNDITRTCANSMVFLGPEEGPSSGPGTERLGEPGRMTVDQIIELSVPIYTGKMRLDYDRPPSQVIQSNLERLGLTGAYWKL